MKKVIRKIVVVGITITMLTGYNGFAYSSNTDLVNRNVNISNPGQKIVIRDSQGKVVLDEIIDKKKDFSKEIMLENLPNGSYTLELDKDFEIEVIPFKIEGTDLEMMEKNGYVYFKPVIRSKGYHLFISKLNFNEAPVKVEVYYDDLNGFKNYKLIHSETITDHTMLERIYKLDKFEKGNYKVIINSESRSFTESFKI